VPRQLVVCLDGTNNRFSNRPTNIVQIIRALDRDPKNVLSYYDQGVGTFGIRETLFEWQKVPSRVFGMAFGWGIGRIVSGAYTFLAQNYQDGDRVFIFGFSRGAYAARALAAMIRALGLIPGYQPLLVEYGWSMLKARETKGGAPNFGLQGQFRKTFGRNVSIFFLGLFDTVSSVGWVYDPVIIPYTKKNPIVVHVRHAVSIDERRCFFRQNLWSSSPGNRTTVKEVWFAGVHSDIGGGYDPGDGRLSRVACRWMIQEARSCGLQFDPIALNSIPGPLGDISLDRTAALHDSMTAGWRCAEWAPRLVWDGQSNRRHWYRGTMPPFGAPRARAIPEGALIHASVKERRGYHPSNLPAHIVYVDDLP
jgi:uncharacterized protein (DUF2235 family)